MRIDSDLGSDYSPTPSPSSTFPLMHPISSTSSKSLRDEDYSDYESDEYEIEREGNGRDEKERGAPLSNVPSFDAYNDDLSDEDDDDSDDEYLMAMKKKFDPRQSHSDDDILPSVNNNQRRGLTTKDSDEEEDEGEIEYGSDLDSTRRDDLAELDYLDFKNPQKRTLNLRKEEKSKYLEEYESDYESDEM